MGNMTFNPMAFIDNLKYMGQGMLGIFIVIGIIILAVYLLAKLERFGVKIETVECLEKLLLRSFLKIDAKLLLVRFKKV